jgi:hypothetical protein
VTSDWQELCERHAKVGGAAKALIRRQIPHFTGVIERAVRRAASARAAIFAGNFTRH